MSIDTKERPIVLTAGNIEALDAIRDEDISIALWERELPAGLSELNLDDIADIRFTADIDELHGPLDDALDEAGHRKGSPRDALHNDIVALAKCFARIMETDLVEIRLEHVTTNACKKFHADYVTARLITTYMGQGTQWLEGDDAADCDCGEPHKIQQMAAGDIALFKGRLWSAKAPAIHRSPPIEGTGEERLVLVINPA
ncbi:DUF1826 domain-containing protein [Parasphingorhabdus sp.]|uniref:DUF1826 domain-containing protein n=1 Tax=Parasphingorhabdus sp. TaxID=2709688 RepID=UPI003A8DAE04